jgi:hypothetical protein
MLREIVLNPLTLLAKANCDPNAYGIFLSMLIFSLRN